MTDQEIGQYVRYNVSVRLSAACHAYIYNRLFEIPDQVHVEVALRDRVRDSTVGDLCTYIDLYMHDINRQP